MIIEILDRADRSEQSNRIDYVFGLSNDAKVKDVEFIGGSCLSPSPISIVNSEQVIDKQRLAHLKKEMSSPNEFNQRAKKTSDHIVISLAEKESLSNADWLTSINHYLVDMGYANCCWFAVKHNDTKYQHAHIVINNLQYEEEKGRYVQVKNNNNRQRSMKARVKIEEALQKRGLDICATPTHKTANSPVKFSSKNKQCRKQVNRLKAIVKEVKNGKRVFSEVEAREVQKTINHLNNTVKSDIHYQNSEKALTPIIKKAHAFSLNKDKPVENFLLYLRSQQVSPLIQFKKQKGKNKKVLKRISGISFLFKGCSFKGSNLGKTLGKEKFHTPFSAASLFSEILGKKVHQKLTFSQTEIDRLKSISDRNYDVNRALKPLNSQEKGSYQFSLLPDEVATLTRINKQATVLTKMKKPTAQNKIKAAITTVPTVDKQLSNDRGSNIKNSHNIKQNTVLTHEKLSLNSLYENDFVLAELSPTFFNHFNSLYEKMIKQNRAAQAQPNFLLFTRRKRHYFALKLNWQPTERYLKEKGVWYQKQLSQTEALTELILDIVKALLEFIRQLFAISNTHSVEDVERSCHVIDVSIEDTNKIQKLCDESEDLEIESHFNRLAPEPMYVDSVNNKPALMSVFMSLLHKVPAHYWLKRNRDDSLEPLLSAIGKHAHRVCEQNSLMMQNRVDDESLSKDMLYYLSHDFLIVYDSTFPYKLEKLKKDDVITAVNTTFKNSEFNIDYKSNQLNLGENTLTP